MALYPITKKKGLGSAFTCLMLLIYIALTPSCGWVEDWAEETLLKMAQNAHRPDPQTNGRGFRAEIDDTEIFLTLPPVYIETSSFLNLFRYSLAEKDPRYYDPEGVQFILNLPHSSLDDVTTKHGYIMHSLGFSLLSDQELECNRLYVFSKKNRTGLLAEEDKTFAYRNFEVLVYPPESNPEEDSPVVFVGYGWMKIQEIDTDGRMHIVMEMDLENEKYPDVLHLTNGLFIFKPYLGESFINTKYGDIPPEE